MPSDEKPAMLWQAAVVLLWRPEFNEHGDPTGKVEMQVSIPNPTLPVELLAGLTGLLAQTVRKMELAAAAAPPPKGGIGA